MDIEELFNTSSILDLSFFNFRNAVTAAYFADAEFRIKRVNKQFKTFFPILVVIIPYEVGILSREKLSIH